MKSAIGWSPFKRVKTNTMFQRFALTLFFVLFSFSTASAVQFDLGKEGKADWATTISYGVSMRLNDPNPENLADPNRDDSERAFEKGDLLSNRVTLSSEADFQWKNLGAFIRGRAFYDFVYTGSSNNDSPLTLNTGILNGGPLANNRSFTDEAEERHGKNVELLDFQ